MNTIQKLTTNLWFDTNAAEAVDFYLSVFKNGSKSRTTYYSDEGQDVHKMPVGSVMTIEFEVAGTSFVALNGGPVFKFNEAVSFIIDCATQEEIDYYWDKLSDGGDKSAQQCGWLKDKFGLSWQIVPTILKQLLADKDRAKAENVMKVMLQMKKMNIQALQAAYDGA